MINSTEFHPEAQAELMAAIRWYNDRQRGLGLRFNAMVQRSVDSILDWPKLAPVWPGRDRIPVVRAAHLSERWPYRIVYFVDGTRLWVVAVAHDKRLPGYWKDRVSS